MEKREPIPVDELLKDIEVYGGSEEVKATLRRFIQEDMADASGIIIIWPHGKHVSIDGTPFSETEGVWALEKAKYELLRGGIKFK